MKLRHYFGFASLIAALVAVAAYLLPIYQPTVADFFALTAVASIIMLSRPSPAAFRAFWLRLSHRTDHPIGASTI